MMKRKLAIPAGRTLDQLKNHYLVEKAIAERLKKASREERRQIYATMYDELFRKVPDHSRLTRRNSEEQTRKANRSKLLLLKGLLTPETVFVEFAPGDCRFAMIVAERVKQVFAVDISDQRNPGDVFPGNFKLIVYNGYDLMDVPSDSIDIVFSDQLIEHFHPEDTKHHFLIVSRILKPGGKYVFRTPHGMLGPHDISKYFSDEPEGFHLKEWTYLEIYPVLMEAGFSRVIARRTIRRWGFPVPYYYVAFCEKLFRHFPRSKFRKLFDVLIKEIQIVATK